MRSDAVMGVMPRQDPVIVIELPCRGSQVAIYYKAYYHQIMMKA